MALLDMCVQEKMNVVVAHVNYHKRNTADRDEKCVKEYCEKYQIKMIVLHPKQTGKGNFQAWARDVRYDFFMKCYKEENAQGLLVGHHQDDLIETYLFQKERKSIPSHYGIAQISMYKEMEIIRPLLNMSKQDCIAYCHTHDVSYKIDESNLTNHYTRNKLRHEIVEKMTHEDRICVLQEIEERNKERYRMKQYEGLLSKAQLDISTLSHESKEFRMNCLRQWFRNQNLREANNSKDYFEQLETVLWSRNNYEVELSNGKLIVSQGICEIVGNEDKEYEVVIQSIQDFKSPYFIVETTGSMGVNACTVKEIDFPLTIRNVRQGDAIQLRFGTKKINRWFIDRKIPLKDRKSWPIVLNCNNEVILVPGIGCNVEHYSIKPNLFVLKY